MNLILHQVTTDLRHFRWRLLVLWLSFAAEPLLAGLDSVSGEAVGISRLLLVLWQAFFALVLIASLVQADALVGTEAAWLTRPLRRRHLFWAKTAFIVLCLLAPRLALQTVGWTLRGYSPHLVLCAAGESLLFSVAFVFAVAALAALTRDLGRFFLGVGIAVGGVFAWVVVVEMLGRAGVIREASPEWSDRATRTASALVVAFLFATVCSLASWISQARGRLWRASVAWLAAGLMAFPVIVMVWSRIFLRPQITKSVPLSLTVVDTNRFLNEPQSQLLWSELVVHGVPDQHVAVAQRLSADVLFTGDRRPTHLSRVNTTGRNRPAESRQGDGYLTVIQSFFPTNTLWFNKDLRRWLWSAFSDEGVFKRFTNNPPAGTLDGEVEVDLYAVKKVAETPLWPVSFTVSPGQRVTLREVKLADGVVSVTLDECAAQLLLDRDVNTARAATANERGPLCAYVLYHPGSGEAYLTVQSDWQGYFPALLSGESHRTPRLRFPYPALRERLAGVTAAEWLREARLWVFVPVYEGTSRLAFHQENYLWAGSREDASQQKQTFAAAETIERSTLPDKPTAEELDAYLDAVLNNVPDSWDWGLRDAIEKKLVALGTNGLPALLRRLPLEQNLEDSFVLPAVSRLATRAQLAELRAALGRDNDVVRLFVEKHWEVDARDVLVAKLRDHRRPLPADALRIAAEARDPATYADLRWHFVRLAYGHDDVLGALEQCPGFDAAVAVREAWTWARLGLTGDDDLATAAAKQGLPEALNRAVLGLESSRNEPKRRHNLTQLAALTGYDGPTEKTLDWLSANLMRFRFDNARQHYVVQPER